MASFRKRGNTWSYRIRYKDPFTQEYKEKSKGGFKTKKEAQLAAAEKEKELFSKGEKLPMMLKDFLYIWLNEYKKDSVRKNTFQQHQYSIEKHILPYFKKILLQDVTPIKYQEFLNHLYIQGYSKRTIKIVHTTMNNAMKRAVAINKIDKNPCEEAVIKGKEKEREIQFIDSNDVPKFLEEAYKYGYIYWIFFKVLIETGMRKGEAAALQWSDIDLKNRTININKTLDFSAKSDDELLGDPKTFNSYRTITISKSLVNDLRYHLNYQNQNKKALNGIYRHDLNLVLCRNDGSPMPRSSLFNAFERICKRAGLPKIPIHSLRHTHAVMLLEAGADMKYVQERLGHGSIQITSDVYSHVSKKIETESIQKFENYFNEILK